MKGLNSNRRKWIETGYKHFVRFGPHELKIKSIAKDAGVSRTTFYHFFADIADYIEQLLKYHHQIAEDHIIQLRQCKTYVPEVFKVVEAYRDAIFFHRQLILHKENPVFFQTYQTLNKRSLDIVYPLWANYFGYQGSEMKGKEIYLMLQDLWYLEMNESEFNYEDFLKNALKIKQYIQTFAKSYELPNVSLK